MSNPNWGKGKAYGLNQQLEQYDQETCMTKEQHDRWDATEEAHPEVREPRTSRKVRLG